MTMVVVNGMMGGCRWSAGEEVEEVDVEKTLGGNVVIYQLVATAIQICHV